MNHTPGPWLWVRRKDGEVYLCHPYSGHLTVMDFVRQGMNKGQPRFATWKGSKRENMGGIMVPAKGLDLGQHPDARLIAAAPDLLAALRELDIELSRENLDVSHMRSLIAAVIARVEGA